MKKKYTEMNAEELRLYHLEAWRRWYRRNQRRLIQKTRDYEATRPDKRIEWNNKATRAYKEKTRFDNMRPIVFKRDNHACTQCGATKQLIVHHKDKVSYHNSTNPNNSLDNLVTLCRSCHVIHHHKEGDINKKKVK